MITIALASLGLLLYTYVGYPVLIAILARLFPLRTGVDEAWRTGSLASEVTARIVEDAFFELDAPIARVCSAEVPMPYAKHLEQAALPQPDKIVAAVKSLLGESS